MSDARVLSTERVLGDGKVVDVTVNRAHKLNALDPDHCAALRDVFLALQTTDARVVRLTGAGDRSFIGGADINTLQGLDPVTSRTYISRVHEVCDAIRRCPVPVVARINGFCLGAGLEIAAACDIRVAEPHAVLGMPEVKVGLPSVVEAALLPKMIGWGHTRWMLLTGENITAERGAQWGLIDILAAPGELDLRSEEVLQSITSAAPNAVRVQKSLMRDWERLGLNDAIDAGIDAFVSCYEGGDEPSRYVDALQQRLGKK